MESAHERKARLKAMREEAAVEPSTATAPVQENGAAEEPAPEKRSKRSRAGGNKESSKAAEPTLKFRNYNVRDDKISHTVLEPAKPPEFREPTVDTSVQNRPQDLMTNLADKKPNQDLRRDVEKALAKLERRTQRALVKIAQTQAVEMES